MKNEYLKTDWALSTVVSTIDGATELPVHKRGQGCGITFDAPAGLYQVSVVADARDFDWDELYIRLDRYHNDNVLTGPWDFNLLEDNPPLVPAYWVDLDGRRLGLWYFQRVSLQ
ncbi:MAG: hypothetical protein K9N51_11315, partial [Candidatus Pacebacteria bacterium]|nr:hypothetical protein [Candidatus Paceibacterota bacterium]